MQTGIGLLTERERAVLLAAGRGFTVKESAAWLNISSETVKTHKRTLMRKLGAVNIGNAIAIACELGIWNKLYT